MKGDHAAQPKRACAYIISLSPSAAARPLPTPRTRAQQFGMLQESGAAPSSSMAVGWPEGEREESQRRRKVQTLHEDVMGRVLEGLRADCRAEGIDERIVVDFKEVRVCATRVHAQAARAHCIARLGQPHTLRSKITF